MDYSSFSATGMYHKEGRVYHTSYDEHIKHLRELAARIPPKETPPVAETTGRLPSKAAERKAIPLCTGVFDYFPLALAEVARVSKVGNDQHNPGQPLHWAREKSTDQADCIARHLIERGTVDSDGMRHTAKLCWRALAMLQLELEAARENDNVPTS